MGKGCARGGIVREVARTPIRIIQNHTGTSLERTDVLTY